jgi:hypothetical protein
MASLIFTSFLEDLARGAIDLDGDTFKVLLTTSAFAENKNTQLKRSDVTGEVAAGAGYTAGGAAATVTVTKDTANSRIDISLGGAVWTAPAGQTLTARKAVYYKARGGAATADELVAVVDFTTDQIASGGTLTLSASTLRLTN